MYIKSLLKFFFLFLFDVIRSNPVKVTFLVLCIIGYINAGTYPSYKSYYTVVDSLIVKEQGVNTHIYITSSVDENKIKYDLLTSNTPLKITNGKYEFMEYHGANIFFWALFGVMAFLLVLCLIVAGTGDDDVSWEIDRCWRDAFTILITCEEENGKFYYMCLGRLLAVRDEVASFRHSSVYYELNVQGFRDLHLYPKFQTKQRVSLIN